MKNIDITVPYFPPIDEYLKLLDNIWKNKWITNNGPLVQELEERLRIYLKTENIVYTSNGTIALQIAIKSLKLKGEIITTPFSYVATSTSIIWEGCKPVYVDIDDQTYNIDSSKIENAINENTSAILATHVFGNPCEIYEIRKLANKYNLKIIYDAAHAFGVKYDNQSIFNFGDISVASFHATKLFHTVEGGALFVRSKQCFEDARYLRNFGHDGLYRFKGIGINGKNSELHAAIGLCVLNYIDKILLKRKIQYEFYLDSLKNSGFTFQKINKISVYNYSYFPLLFPNENTLEAAIKILKENGISVRRYFYPSLNELYGCGTDSKLVNAGSISRRIICLPLFHELNEMDQNRICSLLTNLKL